MSEIPDESSKTRKSKKEIADSTKSPNAWEFDSAVIYVGPTIPKLTKHSTFRAGFPRNVQNLLEEIPELRILFVPVKEFPKVRLHTETVGTLLHGAYQAVLTAQTQKGSV